MPLLGTTGAVAEHVCANCGREQDITPAEWQLSEDDSVLTSPLCPCGSVESFSWHDWVYIGKDGNPDHDHVGAQQMVLIERVATALGRTKTHHSNQGDRRYEHPPQAPDKTKVRAYAARLRGE